MAARPKPSGASSSDNWKEQEGRMRRSRRLQASTIGGTNYKHKNQERKQNMKKTLAEAVKGMQVKSWEVREHSNGKRVVYVRFAPKEPTLTVNVKEG